MSRKKTGKKSKASAGRKSETKVPVAQKSAAADQSSASEKDPKKGLSGKPERNKWHRIRKWSFIIIFTIILAYADAFLNLERKISDFFINFNNLPEKNKQVVIVQVDEDDYRNLFGRMPLEPEIVIKIIDAISLGEPKALGIDIFTSDEIHKKYVPRATSFPIVWLDEPIKIEDKIDTVKKPLRNLPLAANNCSALPVLPLDADRVHRLFQRVYFVKGEYHQTFASLVNRLATEPENGCPEAEKNTQEYYIRFAGKEQQTERLIVSASQILEDAKKGNIGELHFFLENKIVLLGGMFSDSKDKVLVPFGELYSVQIQAAIIETELSGNPKMPISNWIKNLLNMVMILIFTLNFFHYGFGKKSLAIAFSAIFVLAVSISLFQYNSFSSIPLLISIFLYGFFIALFDLLMDKYKEFFSSLFSEISNLFSGRFNKKKARTKRTKK